MKKECIEKLLDTPYNEYQDTLWDIIKERIEILIDEKLSAFDLTYKRED